MACPPQHIALRQLAKRCQAATLHESRLQHVVWSADWLRSSEPEAAASLGISLSDLMVRAGGAAFDVFHHLYPTAKHWLILAGPGNNGGDGYVIARRAQTELQVRVTVWSMPTNKPLPTEAANALAAWKAVGGSTLTVTAGQVAVPTDVDLVVDGLLGTGISGAPRGLYAEVLEAVNAVPTAAKVAIDVPTGLNAETGATPGVCFQADHTVTFICLTPGLLTGQARSCVGLLHYNSLGLHEWLLAPERLQQAQCIRLDHEHLYACFGRPRSKTAHKGSNGKVLLVGGMQGFGGAAVMAAEAALAAGSGLTKLVTAAEHVPALLTRCPEVMTVGLQDCESEASVHRKMQEAMDWADVVAVGPGLGQSPRAHAIMTQVLEHASQHIGKPTVFDADALNILATTTDQWRDGAGGRILLPNSIITPHPGEAARLLQCSLSDIESDRYAAVRRLSTDVLGGVALLKGPGTLVHAIRDPVDPTMPDPHCAVIDAGNAGMATGGMGDVLTGVIAAIAGQRLGVTALDAAMAGAMTHAVAADLVVAERGTRGLRATELLPAIVSCINAKKTLSQNSYL